MRPPNDLPDAQIGSPGEPASAARSAAASIAARQVAIATGGRSGNRRFASRYGKLKRRVANPSPCIARVNPDMNGCSMPAPAPWATTIVPAASAGREYTPDTAVPSTSNVTGVSSITGRTPRRRRRCRRARDPLASTRSPTAAVSSIAPPAASSASATSRVTSTASASTSRLVAVEVGVLELQLRDPLALESEQHRVGQQPLVQVEAGERRVGLGPDRRGRCGRHRRRGRRGRRGNRARCRGRREHRGIRRSQLGAARRLQHPQPVGLGECEVLPQPLEVLAPGPRGRQEPPPRRGRHDDRRDGGGERDAGRDEGRPVAVDECEHDEQRLDEHAEVREDRERHAGPGHAPRCDEPCAGERVLGVLHEGAEPPRERAPIRREAPHALVRVLGPEQRLEQRDLVGREHHVRRHLDADRLALRAGEQAHLALHGEVDEGSGCRPPVGVHEQRVVQHRGAPLGRVLHDRRGAPAARRRRARRSPARG